MYNILFHNWVILAQDKDRILKAISSSHSNAAMTENNDLLTILKSFLLFIVGIIGRN